MALSKKELQEIEDLRATGLTWAEVAEAIGERASRADALRKQYAYYNDVPSYDNPRELAKQRRAQVSAREARKNLRKTLDSQIALDDIMKEIKKVASDVNKAPKIKLQKKSSNKNKITIEALVSDIQIGKIADDFNSDICLKRIDEHTRCIIMKIEQYQKHGYQVERIVLSMLGDMIENSEKHKNSARGTDVGTPEQMRAITVGLYNRMIVPLANLGINVDVKCITGNHDHGDHGLNMFYPGREHLSWMFYNMLAELTKASGIKHVNYEIAEGAFLTYEIYGHTVLVEHGVGIACTEASMASKTQMRTGQLKKHIDFFRMGDKHNCNSFNNGKYIVNGAYFGSDLRGVEYSGIIGYASGAAQTMISYVPRKAGDPRTPLFETFNIQLGHIK